MKPSRELDILVATKVMGMPEDPDLWVWAPRYSLSLEAAWEVVEKLRGVWDIRSMSTTWVVRLSIQVGTSDKRVGAEAETVQHAICLAALKAMGVDV